MMNPFLDWLAEVENDPVVVETTETGLDAEASGNLWTFSLSPQQAQEVKQEEVLHFLKAVLLAREHQVLERLGHQHPMVFYCWFDEQTAQLCFSLVSALHNRLPFGSKVNIVADLSSVVKQFLSSSYHGGVPIEEFVEEDGVEDAVGHRGVSVWTKRIPAVT